MRSSLNREPSVSACGAPSGVHHSGRGCAPSGCTPPSGTRGNPAQPNDHLPHCLRLLVSSQVRALPTPVQAPSLTPGAKAPDQRKHAAVRGFRASGDAPAGARTRPRTGTAPRIHGVDGRPGHSCWPVRRSSRTLSDSFAFAPAPAMVHAWQPSTSAHRPTTTATGTSTRSPASARRTRAGCRSPSARPPYARTRHRREPPGSPALVTGSGPLEARGQAARCTTLPSTTVSATGSSANSSGETASGSPANTVRSARAPSRTVPARSSSPAP